MTAAPPRSSYRRVLIKLSGEALMGPDAYGIHLATLDRIAGEIREAVSTGVQAAIVVGGGNIFRGVSGAAAGMERASADNMGMLATVINALALQSAFERLGVPARVMSALRMDQVAEPWIRRRAIRHLDRGHIVIFAAGTGNPFFTTDTAATLRGIEIGADVVLKATQVDGVYDKDPKKHPDATRYTTVTYNEALEKRLGVMDATAIALARDHNLKLRVFNLHKPGALVRAVQGQDEGTLVTTGD